MCNSRTNNNKINRLHERCLQIVYNDKQSSFNEKYTWKIWLSLNSHGKQTNPSYWNVQFIINLSPPIMNRVFKLNSDSRYNLKQISQFSRPFVKSVYHGTESISYLSPKIWAILPDDYKTIQNLDAFKLKIKKWKPEKCLCRLCKVSIDRVGFL